MSRLTIYNDRNPELNSRFTDFDAIAGKLNEIGVQFERWQTDAEFAADADSDTVLAAYQDSIERLKQQYQFQSVDVIALKPDHPDKATLRQKFLDEHTHADFEIRFFVEGCALFYLHIKDRVYAVLCEQGDLISVPANTPHWFDMGENPDFKCIRFFTTDEGWQAQSSGDDIAKRFPTFEQYRADHA
ncbi:cupin [Methylomarinum sp. Ch1-1]|uniref:Acireductone dioxygenase n=1 Tax=Methylomarinum roseum TaxID=3067653 RepID=A0AAU7NSC2_9GAMM|nr:cupin domain-containing protein [Methylomarinum sp. Ch1-1]MDP4520114.1 cupin domain-containing protein [Methylomarinum sp. Ch1-1]